MNFDRLDQIKDEVLLIRSQARSELDALAHLRVGPGGSQDRDDDLKQALRRTITCANYVEELTLEVFLFREGAT